MKHSILFVDDEPNILSSLKRLLRNEEYEQFYCSSGEEGLEVLQNHQISVIVSDMRMPGMNGVAFLQEALLIQPDTVKIILSGYADINDIMTAINHGQVDNFIKKPWNDDALKIRLKNSCYYFEKTQREQELVQEIAEKNRLLNSMNTTLEEMVRQRTQELEERNRLMQMIVEGKPHGRILEESCEALKGMLRKELVVLQSSRNGKLYPSDAQLPQQVLSRQSQGKHVIIDSYLCVDLRELDRSYGYLYIYPVEDLTNQQKKTVKNFAAVMEMLLLQESYLEKSDLIVSSMDDILEELDAQ